MRISIIGSGNVATHLSAAFKNAGHRIVQVYSRNIQNAAILAYHVGAEAINDLSEIINDTDIFIIAVNDDAIAGLAKILAKYQKLTVHTSGTTGLDILTTYVTNAGVFYPLQTLSKYKEIDVFKVPLCIEGANAAITTQLEQLAQTISNNVYQISTDQRKTLHLAAVFAGNFTNYFYTIAQQLLAQQNLEFEMLRPLILEIAQKVQDHLPGEVQTGPAIRHDEETMASQLQLLSEHLVLQELYRLLSQGIIKNYNAEHRGK